MAGCADSVLPIDDQCVRTTTGHESAKWCVKCDSDSDCVIAGNPCCNANLHWVCVHADKVDKLDECTVTGCVAPPKPGTSRCRCLEGRCHSE